MSLGSKKIQFSIGERYLSINFCVDRLSAFLNDLGIWGRLNGIRVLPRFIDGHRVLKARQVLHSLSGLNNGHDPLNDVDSLLKVEVELAFSGLKEANDVALKLLTRAAEMPAGLRFKICDDVMSSGICRLTVVAIGCKICGCLYFLEKDEKGREWSNALLVEWLDNGFVVMD